MGPAPPGFLQPFYIDDGTLSKGSYVGFNVPATDTQAPVQALTDTPTAGLPTPPPSPSGPTDAGSHQVAVSGNNATQVVLRYTGPVPNLSYPFGAAGNSAFFDVSNIIAHFWVGQSASATFTVGGTVTAGDTIQATILDPGIQAAPVFVGYTVQAGDTLATIAAALATRITTNATLGNRVAGGVFATCCDAAGASSLKVTATTPGVAGNSITVAWTTSPGSTETVTPPGATPLAGGLASGTLGAPSSWAIELVGNGANAGPGNATNTYDVRLPCSGTPGPTGKFTCGPLPAYGATSTLAAPGSTGTATYTPPTQNPIYPGANGTFTPLNPQMYVVLNYASGTSPASTQTVGIDYIYAIQ